MDFETLKKQLQGLIDDKLSTEKVEELGKIIKGVDDLENDSKELVKSHEELRGKYIQAIKDNSFVGQPKTETNPNNPLSLEDLINKAISNRK